MEIWWNSKEDFDNARTIINDPERDSPVGPNGEIPRVELKLGT